MKFGNNNSNKNPAGGAGDGGDEDDSTRSEYIRGTVWIKSQTGKFDLVWTCADERQEP